MRGQDNSANVGPRATGNLPKTHSGAGVWFRDNGAENGQALSSASRNLLG